MEPLLKVPEVAALMKEWWPTAYRYVEMSLPAVRLSEGVLRFRLADVEAWIEERATHS